MLLAHQPAGAVAREVIEKYRNKAGFAMGHPVGTGPYMLSRWTPGSRIILKANPDFRSFVWNFKASSPEDQKIVKAMQGKKMPQIGVIDIQVMEEGQSRWLSFSKDEVDLFQLDGELTVQALQNGYSIIRILWDDIYNNTNDWKNKLKDSIQIIQNSYETPKVLYLSDKYKEFEEYSLSEL
jgi:ABC-type transport system substrate-binding protein